MSTVCLSSSPISRSLSPISRSPFTWSIADTSLDITALILSKLDLYSIGKFLCICKNAHEIDNNILWSKLMLYKGLDKELKSLDTLAQYIFDISIKEFAKNNMDFFKIPSQSSPVDVKIEIFEHLRFAYATAILKERDTILSTKTLNEPPNIYKLWMIYEIKTIEYLSNVEIHRALTLFLADNEIFHWDRTKRVKAQYGNKSRRVFYGPEKKSMKKNFGDWLPESIAEPFESLQNARLKFELKNNDKITKSTSKYYEYASKLKSKDIAPEKIKKALKFDPTLILFIKDPSESFLMTFIRMNPKNIRYIPDPSETLQLFASTQMINRPKRVLKYIANPTKKVMLHAIDTNNSNIRYVTEKNMIWEIYKERPFKFVIKHFASNFILNEEPEENLSLMIEKDPKSILLLDNPSVFLIKQALSLKPKNIKRVSDKFLTADILDWFVGENIDNLGFIIKHKPSLLDQIAHQYVIDFGIKSPKLIKFLEKSGYDFPIQNLKSMILEKNPSFILFTNKNQPIDVLITQKLDALADNFAKNIGVYKVLEERIKQLIDSPSNKQNSSVWHNKTLKAYIIEIRKKVIDAHPYYLPLMLQNANFPADFDRTKEYVEIITNALDKCPTMAEVLNNVPESTQVQSILFNPNSINNFNMQTSDEVEIMAICMNPKIKTLFNFSDHVTDVLSSLAPHSWVNPISCVSHETLARLKIIARQLLTKENFENVDLIPIRKDNKRQANCVISFLGKKSFNIIKKSELSEEELENVMTKNRDLLQDKKDRDENPYKTSSNDPDIVSMLRKLGIMKVGGQLGQSGQGSQNDQSGQSGQDDQNDQSGPNNKKDDDDDDSSPSSGKHNGNCPIQ